MTKSERLARLTPIVDWVLRIVGVAGLIVAGFVFVETQKQADCQARVNQGLTSRAKNLDDDVDRERAAERRADDALAAVVTASLRLNPPTQQEARNLVTALGTALNAQHKAREQADKARAENPPIPLAEDTC